MIKNFVVKVKQIKCKDKGLRNFINYLCDEKRHPDGIINFKKISNNETFFKNTLKNIINFELEKKLNKKGGRKIESYADSFIFTVPPELYNKLDLEKEKEITIELLNKLYKLFNNILETEYNKKISFNTFIKHIFINIHTNKHIHFNFVIPRVIDLGNNQYFSNRITNRKRFLHLAKAAWNQIIFEKLGLSIEDYKPKTKFKRGYKNKYFKNLIEENNKILKENQKIKEEVEEELEKIKKLKDYIEMKRSEIKKEVEKLIKENKEKEKIAKAFQLMIRYYKSLNEKILNKEMKIELKDLRKLERKIEELEKLSPGSKIQKIIDEVKNKTKKIKQTYFKL